MSTKKFHLGDILSITTGFLVSPNHIGGVYEILNYMTGDNLFTHQLPRASDECKPYLLRQMPWLAGVDATSVTPENWAEWMQEQVNTYGEYHDVSPINPKDHVVINPIDEFLQMGIGKSKVIAVEVDNEKPTDL